jgi:hypothetical protein
MEKNVSILKVLKRKIYREKQRERERGIYVERDEEREE